MLLKFELASNTSMISLDITEIVDNFRLVVGLFHFASLLIQGLTKNSNNGLWLKFIGHCFEIMETRLIRFTRGKYTYFYIGLVLVPVSPIPDPRLTEANTIIFNNGNIYNDYLAVCKNITRTTCHCACVCTITYSCYCNTNYKYIWRTCVYICNMWGTRW